MTEIPEIPQQRTGYLLGLAVSEYLLRGDTESLNAAIRGADDVELAFAVSFLAGNLAAYIRVTSEDPAATIDGMRREILDG